jgi:hypothetical protein
LSPTKIEELAATQRRDIQANIVENQEACSQEVQAKVVRFMKNKTIVTKVGVNSIPYDKYLELYRDNPMGTASREFGFVKKTVSVYGLNN